MGRKSIHMQYRLSILSCKWPNRLQLLMNTRQPGTLPSNTIQNPKNNGHCMAITIRGGKQTIDPPMPSNEKKVTKDTDKVVNVDGEL